ncbi:MAG TPA: DUF4386 domain-containing protein [Candidatus Acidoferrales bacterium]|nr:DUF4386 domain-containing protein [Candidatus Acidoferrales bacterium]
MHPTKKNARMAALFYVLMGLPAPFALIYIPRMLIVRGDAAATAKNILAHEMLFRAGVFGELFSAVAFILLALALYRLLSGVDKTQASLMVILVAISVAITFTNAIHNIAALTLVRGADFLAVFDKPQRDTLGMLFVGLHHQGLVVNQIFWGLWLLPFGVLVMRSGFLPRILGVLLIVNCFGYVAVSVTSLLLPRYANLVSRVVLPALLGELWIWLWLLIKGAKPQPLAAAA